MERYEIMGPTTVFIQNGIRAYSMNNIFTNGIFTEEYKKLDQVYDPNAQEDDMDERYEEMNRMREHVMNELDKDKDKLVSKEEFLQYTASNDFQKDEPWDTIDQNKEYTDEEYKEYERMLMEEEMKRRQQGSFDSHAQPGIVVSTVALVKRLKSDAFPSVFPWISTSTSNDRSVRQAKRSEAKGIVDSDSSESSEDMQANFPCDDDNVGNEIYYTAEPCVDVEMTVPNESMKVPSIDSSLTQTLTWPSLCVEKFISEQLSVENQFFLTLIKLRQHKTNFELSRLFNISETAVVNIWVTWVNFMSRQWREVKTFPDRDIVRFFSPHDFKTKFPSTRIIIDGTECPAMKPKSPIAQQSTFSTYKNMNTIKLLVGATPGGLVNYVSPAYGGSTSDRQICERSNLSSICDKGDSIMADKEFNVQDLFAPYDVSINILTFFRKKNRMTGKTVLKDRAISSKRVHIERIIKKKGMAKT
ncbi:unnamed protein product [Mytilus coruscus]|uniref:EF-hand domain-containing protein n=1 Tax=Mytilus coruscus TaxID=42192 RepID=A0A6J8C2G4_MYTCO|nr:unnamed protein product [Mytilus coruscus]